MKHRHYPRCRRHRLSQNDAFLTCEELAYAITHNTVPSIKHDRRTVRRARANRLYGLAIESLATLICREHSERSPVDPPVPDTLQGVRIAPVHFEGEGASLPLKAPLIS